MKVIVLRGGAGSGKTTTINLVYDELVNKGATLTEPRTQVGGNEKDFECILNCEGKSIAFFSMGDAANPVIKAMLDYKAKGCDALVCACNDRFKAPFEVATKQFPGSFIMTKTTPLCNASNEVDKEGIIKLLTFDENEKNS